MTIPAAVLAAATEALRGSPQIQCRVRCASRGFTTTRGPCDCTSPEVVARDAVAAALGALAECDEVQDAVGRAVWLANWGDCKFPDEAGSDRYFVDVTTQEVLAGIARMAQP